MLLGLAGRRPEIESSQPAPIPRPTDFHGIPTMELEPTPTPLETPTETPSTPPLTPKLILPDEQNESAPAPASSSSTEQTFADVAKHVLDFLQHATPETLGGVMVGSTIVLYMVFGSFGLLVVGIMGGVVLHASLENLRPSKARSEGAAIGGSVVEWLDKKILEIRDGREGDSLEDGGKATVSTKVCLLATRWVQLRSGI